ncbi:MAG: phenylalanine--tRNA ligase subunit beta [Ignavibacteriaceae bacterium]|nr:phenylalanine--tRNA ligase subunit beta [Ignavibacteria bacterium]NNJ51659.1 phenylalanine--tRNA ligase subunit beta [Ignavibacteriaceae bacterium]
MNISLHWLKDYVNLDGISTEDIVDKLTMAGLEVEDYTDQNKKYSTLVVGKVKNVNKHPNADRLTVCSVFDGKEDLQIVCGAPNVKTGQIVALASVGVFIPKANFKIEKAKIRGVESFGMICAEDELELSDDHSGIMVLNDDLVPGTLLNEALQLNDVLLDIAITPNRPDALSHIGVARDAAAIFNRDLKLPKIDLNESQKEAKDYASIEIEDKINCPRYTAKVVTNLTIKESPEWLKNKLKSIGLRPINNVVDVTNFVAMELGQPLHAFDLDLLAKKKIIIKSTETKKKFTTLDSKERELDKHTLMICDGEKEVAIAGVMGGENSEVAESTKNILIESAYFNPKSIRKTSRKLQLVTDSSYRFERGTDPSNTLYASQRAAQLISEVAGGEVAKDHIDIYPSRIKNKEIIIRFQRIKKILGFDVPKTEVVKIFNRLGINIIKDLSDSLEVVVPTYRPDIEREVDLIEEVARIYGYNKIPAVSKIGITLEKRDDESLFTDEVRNCAVMMGLKEILNNPLISEFLAKITGKPIKISNPQSRDMAYLRTSLTIAALQTVANNINKGEKDLSLFEIGNVFNTTNENLKSFGDISEKRKLLLLLTGKKDERSWNTDEKSYDFYDLKGLVNSFFSKFSLDNLLNDTYNSSEKSIYEYYFSKNFNDDVVAVGGKVSKNALDLFDIEQDVYSFEIDLDKIFEIKTEKRKYTEPLKYPKINRDFAFIFNKSVTYEVVTNFILEQSSGILKEVEIFDIFESKDLGEDSKSMAFSLEYFDYNKTLTDEEVENDFKNLIKKITEKFNAILRGN